MGLRSNNKPLLNLLNLLSLVLSLAMGLGILAGCQPANKQKDAKVQPAPSASAAPKPQSIEKKYERGPLTFYVRADKSELTIAERLHLTLEAVLPEDYEVELPALGEKLLEFGIVDLKNPLPKLQGKGQMSYQKTCELEPFLSGEYKIPSFKVKFWKKSEKDQVHELESEEFTVRVTSLLPEKLAALAIKDVTPPVQPPAPFPWALVIGIAAVLLLGSGVAGFLIWRKNHERAAAALVKVPAHEVAYAALARLLEDKLIEAGELKLFYTRLSAILRHYMEDRFGLHAPEQTTEEFLVTARSSSLIIPVYQEKLKSFMVHCDLVKFAELQPTNQDIQRTFDICKEFIQATESKEAAVVQESETSKSEMQKSEPPAVNKPEAKAEAKTETQSEDKSGNTVEGAHV